MQKSNLVDTKGNKIYMGLNKCGTSVEPISYEWELTLKDSIKIETVKTDSFSMDYFKFGHGKDTFVILPGVSLLSVMNFADAVADAYKVLADDYTIYVFERKNEITSSYSIDGMAENTSEAFKCLGLDKVTLMGASYGGMIAMLIAARHAEQVQSLILCSTSSYVSEEQYKTFERWISIADTGDAEELYMDFGKVVYPSEMFEQSRGVLADMAKGVTESDLEKFRICLESIRGFDIRDLLKNIKCPVFVVGSNDDMVFGSEGSLTLAKYMDACPDLNIKIYNGYGHAVYDTAPDLKERILKFLKG